ncbi:MAG: 50S ribosomal protein L31e [Candidatus Nanoarchaeia archaeon]
MEREYNVPLRKEWLKAPKYKRAKKAVSALRQFLQKHMKSENVKLGLHVNKALWSKGMRNPPHHVKVTAVKDEDGKVRAELSGVKLEAHEEKKEAKAEAKPVEKKEEKVEAKAEEKKPAEKPKEEKKEEAPKEAPAEKTKEEKPAPKVEKAE